MLPKKTKKRGKLKRGGEPRNFDSSDDSIKSSPEAKQTSASASRRDQARQAIASLHSPSDSSNSSIKNQSVDASALRRDRARRANAFLDSSDDSDASSLFVQEQIDALIQADRETDGKSPIIVPSRDVVVPPNIWPASVRQKRIELLEIAYRNASLQSQRKQDKNGIDPLMELMSDTAAPLSPYTSEYNDLSNQLEEAEEITIKEREFRNSRRAGIQNRTPPAQGTGSPSASFGNKVPGSPAANSVATPGISRGLSGSAAARDVPIAAAASNPATPKPAAAKAAAATPVATKTLVAKPPAARGAAASTARYKMSSLSYMEHCYLHTLVSIMPKRAALHPSEQGCNTSATDPLGAVSRWNSHTNYILLACLELAMELSEARLPLCAGESGQRAACRCEGGSIRIRKSKQKSEEAEAPPAQEELEEQEEEEDSGNMEDEYKGPDSQPPPQKMQEIGRTLSRAPDNYKNFYLEQAKLYLKPEGSLKQKVILVTEFSSLRRADLKSRHDYIQWIFPTTGPDPDKAIILKNNPTCASLTNVEFVNMTAEATGAERRTIRDNMAKNFAAMMRFYGLEYVPPATLGGRATIKESRDHSDRIQYTGLNNRDDHNQRRITRIIACLVKFHFPDQFNALLIYLGNAVLPGCSLSNCRAVYDEYWITQVPWKYSFRTLKELRAVREAEKLLKTNANLKLPNIMSLFEGFTRGNYRQYIADNVLDHVDEKGQKMFKKDNIMDWTCTVVSLRNGAYGWIKTGPTEISAADAIEMRAFVLLLINSAYNYPSDPLPERMREMLHERTVGDFMKQILKYVRKTN